LIGGLTVCGGDQGADGDRDCGVPEPKRYCGRIVMERFVRSFHWIIFT
jgi:hypothetical protein